MEVQKGNFSKESREALFESKSGAGSGERVSNT